MKGTRRLLVISIALILLILPSCSDSATNRLGMPSWLANKTWHSDRFMGNPCRMITTDGNIVFINDNESTPSMDLWDQLSGISWDSSIKGDTYSIVYKSGGMTGTISITRQSSDTCIYKMSIRGQTMPATFTRT